MTIHRSVTLAALAVVAGLGLFASASSESRGPNLQGVVTQVIEADVIEVKIGDRVETVRYIGIKAPEILHPRDGPERYKSAARDANRQLVEGKTVLLEVGIQERDRSGRLLAYVYAGSQFVNAELLRLGYAEVATTPPNLGHRKEFIELQREARERRQGLWADDDALRYYRPNLSGVIGAPRLKAYFHLDDDSWSDHQGAGVVYFESEREALEAGYRPSFNYAAYREREERALRGNLYALGRGNAGGMARNPGSGEVYGAMKALLSAAKEGKQSVVESLLATGSSPDERGTGGETALHWAAAYGHRAIAELLLVRGAGINATDGGGATPLHYAAEEGQIEVARLLVGKGADTDARNANGMTPLHLAAARGHKGIAELLLTHDAKVGAQDNAGSTPLHLACSYGRGEVVRLLLDAGANPMVKDADGNTALELASANDHAEVAALLKRSSGGQ